MWWQEDLERLRREQNPERQERPAIQLPIPEPVPFKPSKEDEPQERGVTTIPLW